MIGKILHLDANTSIFLSFNTSFITYMICGIHESIMWLYKMSDPSTYDSNLVAKTTMKIHLDLEFWIFDVEFDPSYNS